MNKTANLLLIAILCNSCQDQDTSTSQVNGIADEVINLDSNVNIYYWDFHNDGGVCFYSRNTLTDQLNTLSNDRMPLESYSLVFSKDSYIKKNSSVTNKTHLKKILSNLLSERGEGSTSKGEGFGNGYTKDVQFIIANASQYYLSLKEKKPLQYTSKVIENGCK